MKRVEVRGAAPFREKIVEPVEIVVSGSFSNREIKQLEHLGEVFEEDARKIFEALTRTLPQGTLIRLTGLLLNKQALDCYLIVPRQADVERDAELIAALEGLLQELHDGITPTLHRGEPGAFDVCTQRIARARRALDVRKNAGKGTT